MQSNSSAPVRTSQGFDPVAIIQSIPSSTVLESIRGGLVSFSFILITPDGRIICANPVAMKRFPDETLQSIRGKSIHDLMPEEWARERELYLARAATENRTYILVELIAGFRYLTHINPVETTVDGEEMTVLVVTSEPMVAPQLFSSVLENREQQNLHVAECIDLGCLNVLTNRELEILALMGQGLRLKDIAERLNRSVSTINHHRDAIGEKLNINDRAEIIRLASACFLQVDDAKRKRMDISPRAPHFQRMPDPDSVPSS